MICFDSYIIDQQEVAGANMIWKDCICGKDRIKAAAAAVLLAAVLVLPGCGADKAGTVYKPSHQEEDLYIDVTAVQALEESREEKEPPEAEITDSGYTITQIDESDVYPPKETDENGDPLPAWLVNYAVRISNRGSDRALVQPTIVARAMDEYGSRISSSRKTVRTYVLADQEIAVAGDMVVRGQKPAQMEFAAECVDPEEFYPTEEELNMPAGDSYSASDVVVEVMDEYAHSAPSAGRESSEGLSKGYFRLGELPVLSGRIRCDSGEDQEAFVTILYLNGDRILGGETGRVMIPGGKDALYSFSAAGPIPEELDNYEVSAFSIAHY